jgi:hypothetical protein
MSLINSNFLTEKIHIIPYTIYDNKKSIVLKQITENEWTVVSDSCDIYDFKLASIYQIEKLKQNNDIYNFTTVIINDIITNMNNKSNIKEFKNACIAYNIDNKLKVYIDILVLDRLMSLLQNETKLTNILKIWKKNNVLQINLLLQKYSTNKPANVEQYTDLSIDIQKILRQYFNFNIYMSESLHTVLNIIENLITYNQLLIDIKQLHLNGDDDTIKEKLNKMEKIKNRMCEQKNISSEICNIIKSFNHDDYINIMKKLSSDDIKIYSLKRILESYKFNTCKPIKTKIKQKDNNTYYFIEYDNDDLINCIKNFRRYNIQSSSNHLDIGIFYVDDILNETINVDQMTKDIIQFY